MNPNAQIKPGELRPGQRRDDQARLIKYKLEPRSETMKDETSWK